MSSYDLGIGGNQSLAQIQTSMARKFFITSSASQTPAGIFGVNPSTGALTASNAVGSNPNKNIPQASNYIGYDPVIDGPVINANTSGRLNNSLVWDAQGNVYVGSAASRGAQKPGTNDLNSILTKIQGNSSTPNITSLVSDGKGNLIVGMSNNTNSTIQMPAGKGISKAASDGKGNLVLTMSDNSIMSVPLPSGIPGQSGKGISTATSDGKGNLVLTMTDNSTQTIALPTATSTTLNVSNIVYDGKGNLVVTMSDGTVHNIALPSGIQGQQGIQGVGVKSVNYANNSLILTMSDNSTIGSVLNLPSAVKLVSGAVDTMGNLNLSLSDSSVVQIPLPNSTFSPFAGNSLKAQGMYAGWNLGCSNPNIPGGCNGATVFINQRGGGQGGFQWGNYNSDGSFKNVEMQTDGSGNLNVSANINASSFTLNGTPFTSGIQGNQGLPGVKGDTGLQGIQGIPGLPGVKGDTGLQGIPGVSPTGSITISTGGSSYGPGSIFTNVNYGMLMASAQPSPKLAKFAWHDYNDTNLMNIDTAGNFNVANNVNANSFTVGGKPLQPFVNPLGQPPQLYNGNNGIVSGETYCQGTWGSANGQAKNMTCISGWNNLTNSPVSCIAPPASGQNWSFYCM